MIVRKISFDSAASRRDEILITFVRQSSIM